MATAYVKVAGTWKEINAVYVKVAGTWKEVQQGYVKIGSSWKLIFDPVTPGSLRLTSPGNYNFVVPSYRSMTVECWGGGASGHKMINVVGAPSSYQGNSGHDTYWDSSSTLIARAGTSVNGQGKTCPGGTASGGDTNTKGGDGNSSGQGGNSPNGGTGGAARTGAGHGNNGKAPGGGGGGARNVYLGGSGGGAGAYTKKSYARGAYTKNTSVAIKVANERVSTSDHYHGGTGARGEVYIVWS